MSVGKKAMQTKLQVLEENHTWDIVACPSTIWPLGIAKMPTVCTILAIATSQSWPLHQMDVKNVFLHGDLQEDVYIKLPSTSEGVACHFSYEGSWTTHIVLRAGGTSHTQRKDEGNLLDDLTIYRRLVRSLIHLTTTRSDISYVVHKVNQFMSSPRHLHLVAGAPIPAALLQAGVSF
ncbi:uncharacterized protein [Aristolochia californica]|uniref:uncharacterized protein n=1 Tax=Aristolochia californica TaxID=171875 RepID=UPI0035D68391